MPLLKLFYPDKIPHWDTVLVSNEVLPLPQTKGVFESFLLTARNPSTCQRGYVGYALHRHFDRFERAASVCDVSSLAFDTLLQGIKSLLSDGSVRHKDIQVRLQSTADGIELGLKPFVRRLPEDGVSLVSYQKCRGQFAVKYLPATESLEAHDFAKANHADEALLLTDDDAVTETAWGNFFWIEPDGRVATSPHALPGIVRSLLLENPVVTILIKEMSLRELLDGHYPCFITSALHGITPVRSIDKQIIPDPEKNIFGMLTRWWQQRFSDYSQLTFFASRNEKNPSTIGGYD